MIKSNSVVIIGGGHNGLICATYLAKAGHSVLVFALCGTLVVVVSRWVKYLSIFQRTLLAYLIILFVGFLEASVFLFSGLPSAMDNLLMKTLFSALTWPVIDKLIARTCSDER